MNRSESNLLIRNVETILTEIFGKDKRIKLVLGVSGGPDSMSLLYILHRLEIDLTVVHCNYQLRGKASDDDQVLVEETASMWGYEVISVRFDPDKNTENFQNFARKKRYRVFRDLMREEKADAIVTAHHLDDQLETIIQKIMRGAGLTAWQGMEVWDEELLRPLLGISKSDLLQFASENQVPYRLDSSNEESTYARNFLRNGWFPLLDDLFPGWRENILKIPVRAHEYEKAMDTLSQSVMNDMKDLDRDDFLALDPDVRKPVLLSILKSFQVSASVSSGALDNMDRLDDLQTGKRLQITDSIYLFRDRDLFVIQGEGSENPILPILVGRSDFSDGRFIKGHTVVEIKEWDGNLVEEKICFDADAVAWPLTIRTWNEGDKINPLGMNGHQSIADFLTNRKISSARKSWVRVIEASDGKICALLYPDPDSSITANGAIADWVKCTPKTKTAVHIQTLYRR